MSKPEVQTVDLKNPIKVVGKHFKGDYNKSIQYIEEVQHDLKKRGIAFIQNKVFGIYYDNPQNTTTEELRSFQAVFPENDFDEMESSLTLVELKGKFLYTKVTGEPMDALMEGYGALFNHIQNQAVTLKSNTGYQISTFDNGSMTTEIYMELQ
jgi:DNA gyrase inhibitor GyrI